MAEGLVEFLKLFFQARLAFAAWVFCLIVLLLAWFEVPEAVEAKTKFGHYLYGVGGICFNLWLVEIGLLAWNKRKERRTEQKRETELLARLDSLNPGEMFLLATAIRRGWDTSRFPRSDASVCSLAAKGLAETLEYASQVEVPVMIKPVVWAYLVKHKATFIDRARAMNPKRADELAEKAKPSE